MLNGDASSLVVNNQQVRAYLGGFTIEREWPFLSYHFIKESVHKDTPHAVFVLVTEQAGDGGRVECFRCHHFYLHFSLLKNSFILKVFFVACCGSVMERIRHFATSANKSSAFAKAWFMGKSQYCSLMY